MKPNSLKSLIISTFLLFQLNSFAEDIDLFVGLTAGDVANLPNVLFIIDNGANFSASATHACTYVDDDKSPSLGNTTGGMEQCALYNAISGLKMDGDKATMNIGLMAYNANKFVDWMGVKCDKVSSLGGCLMLPIITLNSENKALILAWIKTWETGSKVEPLSFSIKTNNQATGAVMQEAWAYFAGRTGISGRSYEDIKPISTCMKNYVVFVGNAYNNSGSSGDQTGNKGPKDAIEGNYPSSSGKNAFPAATLEQKKIYQGPVTTMCGTVNFSTTHENRGLYADEWARYMASEGTTALKTYTIGVHGDGCQAEYAGLLSSMATLGGGKYFPTKNFDQLKIAFESILSEVQPVNSAFASVSLPVSVNTQGTYQNQVFIGMFRPDEDAFPRWSGNLKQYRMGMDGGVLKLMDAGTSDTDPTTISSTRPGSISVVSKNTGFITGCARSFWTPTTDDDYWASFTDANCINHPATSNTPDGNIVEKGAQGYKLRSMVSSDRKVKTCNADCSALVDFVTESSTITQTSLEAADSTEREAIIDWTRGLNNNGEFSLATAMRPSAHSDVVHSRPVALDFGTDFDPKVVVFYGSNDGALRAINGNRSLNINGVTAGSELWSFIAPESYPILKRLRDNSLKISFPGATGGSPKPYGVDGPIVAYKDASQTLIFASMRRGGNALYAFEVADSAGLHATPTLKWKRSAAELDNLGQTWSPPKVLKTAGYVDGTTAKPMLILGGGYDTCEDSDPYTCSTPPKGNRVYVMDAVDGTVLKTFSDPAPERSVIAEIFVVPDAAGLAKYAYAVDLGGNIYRISGVNANTAFSETDPANWTMTKIASLGGTGVDARKFMFSPDVLDENGTYVLLLGSGDREKPLTTWTNAAAVKNYFFMVKDRPSDTTWLTSENTTCSANVICKDSLLGITTSANPTPAQLASKPKGWYLGMANSEQVVTAAITVYGTVTFSTHIPAQPAEVNICKSNLGTPAVYNVSYSNAGATSGTTRGEVYTGSDIGLPPSPVAGRVKLDDGTVVSFIIGASADSPLESKIPPSSAFVTQPKSRVYWHIQK